LSLHPDIAAVLAGEKRWALVHADNAEVLPRLPDKAVAHVITDPPYSEWVHAQHMVGGGARRNGAARYKDLGFDHLTAECADGVARHVGRLVTLFPVAPHE
jgi:hypothetical protein